jgi:MinD-like ATPase involved in chromosome partitioning or flagellar assembly
MSIITLNHPDGSVRLDVPRDIALGELMEELLEVTGQPDRPDWTLSAATGDVYPAEKTLAELGVTDGSVLVLHASDATTAPTPPVSQVPSGLTGLLPMAAPPRVDRVARNHATEDETQRPVSARTASVLPVRLLLSDRLAVAARALFTHRPSRSARSAEYGPTGTPDPATFTLPARVSPVARMRQAWAQTEYDRLLERQITAYRLRRCATIAVVSPKGGVGKSTTTALLGSLLAHLRRDRVVAIDTNPDWGSLGRRLVPNHPVFIDDLLTGPLKDGRLSATQLDAQLGRGPDGLMVAPAPTDPARAHALDEHAYCTLFARLGKLVGTLVLDCGTGLNSPAARAALGAADQVLLVADGEPDTASIVAEAAQYLQQHAPPLVLVANKLDRSSRVDVDALEREVPFAHGIVRIPISRAGAEQLHASHFSWTQAPSCWTIPVRQLAALLVSDWRRLNIAQ